SLTAKHGIILFHIKIFKLLGPDSDLDSDAHCDDLFSDDSHDTGPDEPDSPTVLLDKKTRRRFLDLGVTLRRTYGKVRKDRSNRLSAGNRDSERTENRSLRSSGPPFVPFSWFSERLRGSGSPKNIHSPSRPFTQGSSDEDFDSSVGLLEDCRPCKTETSQPYHTLPEHSDGNDCDSSRGTDFSFKKKMLSASGKDRTERQNGVHGKRDSGKNGHSEDGQKLLTS
uniref:Sterile alpha motif domain containing 14 n=1 Tax=Cyprinus carpio TaxID=7962 RepID=A0A8C2I2K3_CYPCA